jgi:hypothetical protein
VISVVTYAALAGSFPDASALRQFLDSLPIAVFALDEATALLAGQFTKSIDSAEAAALASFPTAPMLSCTRTAC